MGISPVEFSGFTYQRSDTTKIVGDDYLKIQQQQLASITAMDEDRKEQETVQVADSGGFEVDATSDQHPTWASEQDKEEENEEENNETDTSDEKSANIRDEYVQFQDPDLGHSLDWRG